MHTVIEQLSPLLRMLVDMLNGDGHAGAALFFDEIRSDLDATTDEMDLLALFTFRLANSDEIVATYGLTGAPVELIDLILQRAVEISAAYSADEAQSH